MSELKRPSVAKAYHVFLLVLFCGMSVAAEEESGEKRFGIEFAPEVWYAKWQPSYDNTGNCTSSQCNLLTSTYKVAPAMVSGISLLGTYGKTSLFLDYRGVHKLSGDAAAVNGEIDRWREVVAGGLFWIRGDWFLDSSLSVGAFTGQAQGTEWTRGVGSTVRSLPINTTWVEGELDVVLPVRFELQSNKSLYGVEVGYRINRYRLPALVEVYDDNADMQQIVFEDTSILLNSLVVGLRELPDPKKQGWGFAIPVIKGSLGVSKVSSQHLNGSGFAFGVDGEAGIRYSHKWIQLFLGGKGKMLHVSAGPRPADSPGQRFHAGSHMQLTDVYYGPTLKLTARF